MFCADDDESAFKTSVVHPNDVLDIELSVGSLSSMPLSLSYTQEQIKGETSSKPKEKKSSKATITNTMKRGDPFLPSVISDENPIADYTIKKNSRKKPSDCKCKGFGYNVSPSALLPEEMRQQWGVGMFGKPTLIKTNLATVVARVNNPTVMLPAGKNCELQSSQDGVIRNVGGCSSSVCVLRSKNCRQDPCLCDEVGTPVESFRVPESSDRKKPNFLNKTSGGFKSKDKNKSPNHIIVSNTASVPMIKRITYYNNKEKSNIISTSNFQRTPVESLSSQNVSIADNFFKGGYSTTFVSSRNIGSNDKLPSSMKGLSTASREVISLTARARHRIQSLPPRRILANISPSPILTSTSVSSSQGSFEAKKSIFRNTPQMLTMSTQGCACDSCRQRANLMLRMEALGFSSSHAQHMLSPFLFTSTQRYQQVIMQPSLTNSNRYAPYTVPNYGYSRASGVYRSPERYHCSSPTYYDYSDIPNYQRQPFASMPLSMVNDMSKIESAFLDSENSLPSPPSTVCVEDITDLSIQDTVDFFVSMKSPFVNSTPSPVSDSSPGNIYSAMSPVDRCLSPNYSNGSLSCFCSSGNTSSFPMPQYKRDSGFIDRPVSRYGAMEGPSQPISYLYSSLVSDLEDELQCAIENIPTG